MPFHSLADYRGPKLWSHPILFLAPHAVIGSTILILHALYLLDYNSSSTIFFPLAVFFAIHIIPERAGIPNRRKVLPLNEMCVVLIFLGSSLFFSGFIGEQLARSIVILPCLGAPILEILPVLSFLSKKAKHPTYKATSKDGNEPLKRNMDGYSGICPFAKAFDISTKEYPSSSTNKKD